MLKPALLTASILPSLAAAQPVDHGITWRTIGNPGNPGAQPSSTFPNLEAPLGAVNHTYRLSQTELSIAHWTEFVRTYSQLHPVASVTSDPGFYGRDVHRTTDDPANPGWYYHPESANTPATMSWLYAARYCNWLHNGKLNEAWSFESGAYDMSTFHEYEPGRWAGQTTRSPGALYWIPSRDEWVKGMYWDPNRSGPGQGGYWMHPISSDTPAVPGAPGTAGAQTNAGRSWEWSYLHMQSGSYPDAQSPWGLLDGSGGVTEYYEGWVEGVGASGSMAHSSMNGSSDVLDALPFGGPPNAPVGGLRIASAVPGSSVLTIIALALAATTSSRRRLRR